MNTIFIGGSRHISRLSSEVKKRLENVVASGHQVIVGDAGGADKAVQKYLLESQYDKVTVFCSGATPRNNLGSWRIHSVDAPQNAKGVHFFTVKDREMAREADFGLMIWDGRSPGTILNVLRLVQSGKISVLYNAHTGSVINIKSADKWRGFLSTCSQELLADLKERATPAEWAFVEDPPQRSLLTPCGDSLTHDSSIATRTVPPMSDDALAMLNRALASGDSATIVEVLGRITRDPRMSEAARDSGLVHEQLHQSMDAGQGPVLATIVKVLALVGLRLEAKMLEPVATPPHVHAHTA